MPTESRFTILLTLGMCFVFSAIQICNHQKTINLHGSHIKLFSSEEDDENQQYQDTTIMLGGSAPTAVSIMAGAAPVQKSTRTTSSTSTITSAWKDGGGNVNNKSNRKNAKETTTRKGSLPSLQDTIRRQQTEQMTLHEQSKKQVTPNVTATKARQSIDHNATSLLSSLQQSKAWNRPTTICELTKPLDEITYSVLQKLRRGYIQNQQKLAAIPSNVIKPRILCMVYTHQGAHDNYLRAIVDTWAKRCDGFFAASNVTDPSLGAIRLEFPGPESYDNMWQKVLAMWKYAHDNYLDDYDYFHICGDDTFVIPDNMRLFLMSKQVEDLKNGYLDDVSSMSQNKMEWSKARPRPLMFGFPIQIVVNRRVEQFPAGGSGYTLNREALRVFYETIKDHPSDHMDSREDMMMARLLSLNGITCSDTRDEFGAFRYVPDNLIAEYKCLHRWPGKNGQDYKERCHDGLDGFSNETVSIHVNYRKSRWLPMIVNYTEEVIYRFVDLLSGKCDDLLLLHEPNVTKMELLYDMGQRSHFKRKRVKALENNHVFGNNVVVE